jgi:hypothetical protein
MCDAQNLVLLGQLPELLSDHRAHAPTDSLVDFIEHHGWDLISVG